MEEKGLKVAVGLSGGVDSSVAAYLLKKKGCDVTGVYMQCWEARADGCRADEDRADAVKVAAHLGIPFEHLHFEKEYRNRVIEYFYREYEAGRTPNPDVVCNREIKFGLFLDWALDKGFNFIATGHYAGVRKDGEVYRLVRGVDATKDQSYFLYTLTAHQLSKAIFPLREMRKKEVRELAKKLELPTAVKPDSVGICFIGEVDMREFLKKRIKSRKGNVVDKKGEVIGKHDGAEFYTIGQRHGFRVDKYHGLPLYVIGKNVGKNELVVAFGKDGLRDSFDVEDVHWIVEQPQLPARCDVRIRHLGELYDSSIVLRGKSLKVVLGDPIFGVAAGQSAVFYSGDEVLGGGVIAS